MTTVDEDRELDRVRSPVVGDRVERSLHGATGEEHVVDQLDAGDGHALVAGPRATLDGAPILLVTKTAVPGATAQELTRLAPDRIVVIDRGMIAADFPKSRYTLNELMDIMRDVASTGHFEPDRSQAGNGGSRDDAVRRAEA